MKKIAKTISNIFYGIGATMTLLLGCVVLLGSYQVIDPNAMLPRTWSEQAFIYLALGMIPMFLACIAAYHFNGMKSKPHKIRNFILLFLPGFICAGCALFCFGVLLLGYINMFRRGII